MDPGAQPHLRHQGALSHRAAVARPARTSGRSPRTKTLLFPPGDIFYDLRVVAHEYAHLLREGTGTIGLSWMRAHDGLFENTYREVCLHLGAFATPTVALLEEFKRKLDIDRKAVQ